MSAVASPNILTKTDSTSTITTSTTTVTVTGGTPPYTHSWQAQSADDNIFPTNASSATTAFTSVALLPGQTRATTYADQVTDSLGVVAISNVVSISITRT